jgi:hypothetical protein
MCRSDAAYVLGALSPIDRRVYEDHLRDCAVCQASVQRIAGLPGLLALTSAEDVEDSTPKVPDTLLPGLIARAQTTRRRRAWIGGGLLAAAVAGILTLAGTLVVHEANETAADYAGAPAVSTSSGPTSTAPSAADPVVEPLTQVLPGPMTASLELVNKKWGTAITVVCQYDQQVNSSVAYDLAVIDTDGNTDPVGTWRAVPGVTSRVTTATAVPLDKIASFEVRLPDGMVILRSAS